MRQFSPGDHQNIQSFQKAKLSRGKWLDLVGFTPTKAAITQEVMDTEEEWNPFGQGTSRRHN